MRALRPAVLLTACILAVSSCRENVGPAPTDRPVRNQVHQLLWAPGTTFRAGTFTRDKGPFLSAPMASPPLSTNQISFWAKGNAERSVEVDYFAPDASWRPYMVFTVPAGSLRARPDGTPLASGDSVLITATIDPVRLQVSFEPTGLSFNDATPARLTIWYTGAERDFDTNGIIDDNDSFIEENFLGLWVQETAGSPWTNVPAVQSLVLRSFVADIKHFSGYTLSW